MSTRDDTLACFYALRRVTITDLIKFLGVENTPRERSRIRNCLLRMEEQKLIRRDGTMSIVSTSSFSGYMQVPSFVLSTEPEDDDGPVAWPKFDADEIVEQAKKRAPRSVFEWRP